MANKTGKSTKLGRKRLERRKGGGHEEE